MERRPVLGPPRGEGGDLALPTSTVAAQEVADMVVLLSGTDRRGALDLWTISF